MEFLCWRENGVGLVWPNAGDMPLEVGVPFLHLVRTIGRGSPTGAKLPEVSNRMQEICARLEAQLDMGD